MIDVGIRESTATTGTGTVTLAAVAGFARISQCFAADELVSYCITDGNDREWGIGLAVIGSNQLTRQIIVATLVAGVFTRGGSALNLDGNAIVDVTPHNVALGGASSFVDTGLVQRFVPHATNGGAMATLALTANRGYFMPFVAGLLPPGGLQQIGIEVTTASAGAAFAAIFASNLNGSNKIVPGTRLYQSASLDTGTTGEKLTAALNIRLRPSSIYWMALTGSAAATVRAVATGGNNAMLGMTNAATTARTHIFATQAGAFGTDASALAYTIGTGSVPAVVLAP